VMSPEEESESAAEETTETALAAEGAETE